MYSLTSFPDPAQLSVAFSTVKQGEPDMSYSEVLFKALILMVNLLHTTIRAYALLPNNTLN